MIKNIIFDCGQVLIHFEPAYMTGRYVTDENDAKLVEAVVFDRLYWDRLDDGTITDEEVVKCICNRLPERLHKQAEMVYYNWIYNIPEIEGMRELIRYIKSEYGVKTFLLSNISKYFASHREEIEILNEIDHCVFSAVCGLVKPDRKIFEHICEKYSLKPEESVFIDDNEANIKVACDFGIKGYLFDGDVVCLKKYLEEILSE